MSKIKVYVRVRPPLPGEFDTPGCYNCVEMEDVSGNWIQIVKDGEPKRYFARCWGPNSTQEEVFRTVGVTTVNDVFEGYFGCIFVYGQTGTGKTFSLGCSTPGLEGVQPRCLQMIFEKAAKESAKYEVTVKNQYIQLYRANVQDLLNTANDNMKVRVEEGVGAIIEGCTTRDVTSYEEALALIKEGDNNRAVANTKMNSASSRSHACLITEITRKDRATGNTTLGKLYLIDLAGSERPAKSGVIGDAYAEAVAINKSLTVLGNCISALVNGEKQISFRDSPITRILQYSLTGHGRTSIIVTIRPDSPNLSETICTLKFAERAQKVEAQMTPAAYQEQAIEIMNRRAEQDNSLADAALMSHACKAWAKEIKESVGSREQAVREAEAAANAEIAQIKADLEDEKKKVEKEFQKVAKDIASKGSDELDKLKTENASVLGEIEKKVKAAEVTTRAECDTKAKALTKQLADVKKEHKTVSDEAEKLQAFAKTLEDGADPEDAAKEAMEALQEKIAAAKKRLRSSKQSKNAKLPLGELRDRLSSFKEILEKLQAKKQKLELRAAKEMWDTEEMKKKMQKPPADQVTAFVEAVSNEPPPPEEDDDSAPPSDEPPPTDSDMDSSSDSDSDSDSSSDSDSDSDSDSGSGSEAGEKPPEEPEEEAPRVELDLGSGAPMSLQRGGVMPGASIRGPKRSKNDVLPRKQFDNTMKRDIHLAELLEQILEYLEYGSIAYVIETSGEPEIKKRHLYIGNKRKTINLCEYKSDGGPDRSKAVEICKISDITKMVMGQFSKGFLKALEGAPMVPQGTTMPESSAKISLSSLPIFFYRSITIAAKKEDVIDFVLDADTDFEAWVVTLHRVTLMDLVWGGLLDVTSSKEAARLNEEERKLCIENHIIPATYLQTKQDVLHSKEPQMFYTLLDFRSIASMDLYHSQKLFEHFLKQGYLERIGVYQVRYLELKAEKEEEKRKKEEIREYRVRIVNMLQKYKPAPAEAVQQYLKTIVGKEKETLETLVKECGPEPTPEEIAKSGADKNQPDPSAEDPPPPPPED
jgi:hypothetical protein